MNETKPQPSDDELIRRIRDAFDEQATPACPPEDDWFSPAKRERGGLIQPALLPVLRGNANWVPSAVALAAIVGIAIVFFGSSVDENKVKLPQDEYVDLIDADDNDSVKSVAQQGELNEQPNVISQNPKTIVETLEMHLPPRASVLLNIIAAANDFLTEKNNKPDLLIEQLHSFYAFELHALQSGFQALGVPAGITSVTRGVDSQRSWVQGKDQVAYTYGIEYPQVLADLTRLLNGYIGVDIVDDMLDTIRDRDDRVGRIRDDDEPTGFDFRKDFFPLLGDKIVLVVSTQLDWDQDPLTIVMPVKDATKMWRSVNQYLRLDPDASRETYSNVEMFVIARTDTIRNACCIVEDHLIIGDLTNVQAIIDRLN